MLGEPFAICNYEVKLIHFNDYIRKLLRITRLDKVFGIPDESPCDER